MEGGTIRIEPRPWISGVVARLTPLFVTVLVLTLGCSASERPRGGGGSESESESESEFDSAPLASLSDAAVSEGGVDNDNDGCEAGHDCDDTDANYCESCPSATPCPDCWCDVEGMRAGCDHTEASGDNGVSCGLGVSSCRGAIWQECVLNNSGPPQGAARSVTRSLRALTEGSTCVENVCDPTCREYVESPEEVGDPGEDVIVDDGGVTLPGGTIPPDPNPCAGGDLEGCPHHICEPGVALTSGCGPGGSSGGTERGVIWSEDFSDNSAGWSLGNEWEIGSATASSGHQVGFPDPDADTTPTSDNGVAGVDIGGNADRRNHGYYYLTSPKIDLDAASGALTLSLQRYLNSDRYPYMRSRIQVRDQGGTWRTLWQTGSSPHLDDDWRPMTFDITAYRSDEFQVRFGFRVYYDSVQRVSSWNIDDVEILADVSAPATDGCVALVCEAEPTCCNVEWTQACTDLVLPICKIDCQKTADGECISCFQDGLDHDGDGSSYLDGDCLDCDPNAGPGAYDFANNGVDEDCDGLIDNAANECDEGLSLGTLDPDNFARAMDLCQFTTAGATGPDKKWGVIDAKFTRADGSLCSDALQKGVLTQFGINNFPQEGDRMAAFSSGTARSNWEPGFVPPNGSGYGAGQLTTPPAGFPQNSAGCATGKAAIDSCGLELLLRAPTNAESFSFDFDFFSSEYPEWVCTAFNDTFIALYDGASNPFADKNISFDQNGDPVSVNVGFFGIPGGPTIQHPLLAATGHDGVCPDDDHNGDLYVCGGGTDWLRTSAPVNRGEEIKIRYLIWDTGDRQWDSTVLLDNFKWSALPATIETKRPDGDGGDFFAPGDFVLEYDALQACLATEIPVWSLLSWTATTGSDSRIEYYVTNADELEGPNGLDAATEVPLRHSNPPGPAALLGNPVAIQSAPVDTQSGSAFVGEVLDKTKIHRRFLRIRAHLVPSVDLRAAPVLHGWNLEISCLPGT